ncbi:hypothetical protein ES332_D11G399700v1 [Gossypium tomentosum]|uniref:Uncharacterized protein n=1 Tax=Gossypium tomentosum TaxID=34277 RepID=A0A5D2IYY8_GOSTO|nr:hypothetical protein ES332_D11G399700v1 [Gossypium tomentosum]
MSSPSKTLRCAILILIFLQISNPKKELKTPSARRSNNRPFESPPRLRPPPIAAEGTEVRPPGTKPARGAWWRAWVRAVVGGCCAHGERWRLLVCCQGFLISQCLG